MDSCKADKATDLVPRPDDQSTNSVSRPDDQSTNSVSRPEDQSTNSVSRPEDQSTNPISRPTKQSTDLMSKPDPPEGSCHFFIERKKRFCRFRPAKNSSYCAEHVTAYQNEAGRKRMVCPYDSKHTCYVDKLTHHMNRCPSRPKEMPAYYSKGINSGDDAGELVPSPKVTVLTVAADELLAIIEKVNKLYDEYVKEIPIDILSHPCLREELENTTYGTAALRHRRQMASLIGHLEKLECLRSGLCYVEMGAGKGQLTHWLHQAVEDKNDTSFVLIDRSHVRNKMDNLHKEEEIMKRYRIDIEHLKLGNIPAISGCEKRPVVAYGKHLCGPATDLALRCATETLPHSSRNDEHSSEEGQGEPQRKKHKSGERPLAGCVIALCCHHRCTWPAYVGKEFFRSCGLSAREFQLLSSMSSWATCTWKGWSHTKKTEEDQMSTGNGLKRSTGSDVIDQKCEGVAVTNNFDVSKEMGLHSNVILNSNKTVTSDTDICEVGVSRHENKVTTSDSTGKLMNEDCKERIQEVKTVEFTDSDGDEHCDVPNSSMDKCIQSQLSEQEREVIGRKCKRLIDYGRVKYLEDCGLISSLSVYIEDFYTPENVVLLARLK